ncbi:olfactory receptor 6C74-like [Pelodiscus sinensis]|uniref:olfactory receptor 6C74-like n=1 Tax=Pelodiscus sinensis TaxID=13735 RepID=UPI000D723FF4|nr:olfactory receptor 6C74-like [Pelodiscus sinensis]|eukprot:XP_025035956.1 olfactory receptor 6C74-like [Pelodiscus sinensis]
MEKSEGRNQTPIVEFILLEFGNDPELQPLLFLLFLLIYLVTLAGNLLIVALVVANQHLHTPMYFFLGNLSCLEICYSTTFLPRLLTSLLTEDRSISIKGCIMQLYFFGVISTVENLLLAVMSYDRYLAICQPLRYAALMNDRVCGQLVAGAWISSFLSCTIVIIFVWQLTFCDSKEIDHFFCDFSPILKLSCDDTLILQLLAFTLAAVGSLVPCLLTLTSYVCIITTILRIPSSSGRQKAFSTCSSHLIVVTIYYGTVITVYVVPTATTLKILHKIFSVFYTVLTPMINPVIYCLRNKEVKECLRRAVHKLVAIRNGQWNLTIFSIY